MGSYGSYIIDIDKKQAREPAFYFLVADCIKIAIISITLRHGKTDNNMIVWQIVICVRKEIHEKRAIITYCSGI